MNKREITLNSFEGVGAEAARALASANAHVIITTRDLSKGTQIVDEIKKTTRNPHVEAMEMNLSSLESVKNFVYQFRSRQLPIHILICK